MRDVRQAALGAAAAMLATACASTGATWRSGVGDSLLEHAPYYAGLSRAEVDARTSRIGHLPVAYQRGAAQSPIFDPSLSAPVRALLADMTAYLDSLGVTARVAEGGRVSAVTSAATEFPPDVSFGCVVPAGTPDEDCLTDPDEARGRHPRYRLAVGRPSNEWRTWASEAMESTGADAVLVITLEVGQYPIRQSGWRGTKEVVLGTENVVKLPWLTSLDQSILVLQLTGAVVGRDGKVMRIGAEGLMPRRTPFLASAAGLQALITDDDVAALRSARREDVPGKPLVWQAGLRQLVQSLVR